MQIYLTELLELYIQSKVDSGLYNDASEVISEALRAMIHQDQIHEVRLAALHESIATGQSQAEYSSPATNSLEMLFAKLDEEESTPPIRKAKA
jgi:antitoxin ParD1/3/4